MIDDDEMWPIGDFHVSGGDCNSGESNGIDNVNGNRLLGIMFAKSYEMVKE